MKKSTLLLAFIFLGMLFVSCNRNDTEVHSYKLISDDKVAANEIVDGLFSNMENSFQNTMFKNMIRSKIESFTDSVEKSIGVQDIVLGFRKVAFSYNSIDLDNSPIELSSAALWYGYYYKGVWYDIAPQNICLMEHYTITANHESPTQGFPMELLVAGNTLTIMPDYIGYGITRHLLHPYLNHEICAINSVDALPAGYDMFNELSSSKLDEDWKLYVLGASQGGGNALAVHKYFDTHDNLANEWHFEYSYAAAGPHNPILTIDKYLEEGKTALPVVFPLTLKAMFDSYPEYLENYTEDMMFSERYLRMKNVIDEMLKSKNYTTAEINKIFYDSIRYTIDENLAEDEVYLCDILSDDMFNSESDIIKDLYKCLDKNDLTKGWTPKHHVKLFYGANDRIVPYENSISVYDTFGSKYVTLIETEQPSDHLMACGLWMMGVFLNGF